MKKLTCAVLTVIMLTGICSLALPASAARFSDVEPGRWSETYINYA